MILIMSSSMNGAVTEQKKEKHLSELLTSSMVDIYVGSESTHWPLHERLLCYHSPFFSSIFYKDDGKSQPGRSRSNKSYGLPDEDDYPFELLVGWLYSRAIRAPKTEKDIGPLLDLYLLSDKFEMAKLSNDVVDTVREWYHVSGTYPGLRRVQYIYSNTSEDNLMREMMVNSIARLLTTSDKIPTHWAKALMRDGQLAVDIIRSIQQWKIEERSIPDARDGSTDRGRAGDKGDVGFSKVVDENIGGRGNSVQTEDTDLGIKSINTDASEDEAMGVKSDSEEEKAEE